MARATGRLCRFEVLIRCSRFRLTISGLSRFGKVELAPRFGVASHRLIRATQVVVGFGETWREFDSALEGANCLIISLEIEIEFPQGLDWKRSIARRKSFMR